MPYISKARREAIFGESKTDYDSNLKTAGELNYYFTYIINEYLEHNNLSYEVCNSIIGALDNCKDEFRRRVLHKYEDKKIKENGDVYNKKFTR